MPALNSSIIAPSTPQIANITFAVDPQLPDEWYSSKYMVWTIRTVVLSGSVFLVQLLFRRCNGKKSRDRCGRDDEPDSRGCEGGRFTLIAYKELPLTEVLTGNQTSRPKADFNMSVSVSESSNLDVDLETGSFPMVSLIQQAANQPSSRHGPHTVESLLSDDLNTVYLEL